MDYTYNPEDIINPGKDRMRFELGDTVVDKEHEAAALSDQEYIAIITAAFENEKGWKYAKLKCLEAICMKLSFEVSTYRTAGIPIWTAGGALATALSGDETGIPNVQRIPFPR